ncbi:MAG: peptidoglycan-associated lipoprotein [Alphaproteobacteria bacterium HGW-Alphaproteobacteria-17]|nr:peptidoglycan-associated lipoprotein Pal [Sphingopyxis solisilvae]PKP86136.1 MAG: peptidoglycan-associated lipoprotein [Alphaproteobacteria bacterium HGW-Alphaproteobacteria-17]
MRKSTAMIAAITMLAVGACAKKTPNVLPPAPDGVDGGGDSGYGGVVPGSQEDFLASVGAMGDRIFFGFDQYNIDAEDMTTLRTQAQWLQRNPAVRVTLEGHADERGTRDYNIALGERRANAAKNYLASLGIDPSRINVISYGKERPAELGSTEEAYSRNRRAVTVVIGR